MDIIEAINFAASWFALGINGVLLILAAANRNLKEKVFRWFFVILILNFLMIMAEFAVYFLQGRTSPVIDAFIRVLDFFTYAIGPLQYIAYILYLNEYLSTKATVSKKPVYMIVSVNAVAIILAVVAQFNHMYARFDELNFYHQADTYWISVIPVIISMAIFTEEIMRHRKILNLREQLSLPLYFALPLLCFMMEIVIDELWLSHVGATVAFFVIYVNIQLELKQEQDEQRVAQQAELIESRIAIMLSQMQPHFLYNALGAIQDLCKRDAAQAEIAVRDFSKYLRRNIDSLSRMEPHSFKLELEHVKTYLTLEKKRFEEKLNVVYDIQTVDFPLPPLTLQTLVENAVTHGVTERVEGGTVTIRTKEEPKCWRVTVEDDGVGFIDSLVREEKRSHIGIENTRRRLELSGGSLVIHSTPNIGTTAIITIPKGEEISL